MPRPSTLDTTLLARLLNITPRHLRKLRADGILNRARDEVGDEIEGRYELVASVHAYIKHLQQSARWDDSTETTRARLVNQKLAAEAQIADLRLQQIKGQLHRAVDVEFVLTNMLTAIKQHLLSIPSRVARLLVGLTSFQKIYDIISREIELVLRELSAYSPAMFARQTDEYMAAQAPGPETANGAEAPGDNGTAGEAV
jgi:phage terminase Nu1 subunit (DNA packaging protein)